MSAKQINKKALENYHKNEVNYWILGIFCGILMGGCFAIGLAGNFFLIIIIPFLVIPIFFAGHVAFIAIQKNEKITFGKALNYFLLYFKAPFNSCFSFIKTFFKSLLIYLVSFILFAIISYQIVNAMFPIRMKEFVENFNYLVSTQTFTIEQLNELLSSFKDIVVPLTYTASIPPVVITLIFFTYNITTYSMNVYFRLACPINDQTLLTMISKMVGTKTRKTFRKDYLYMIWPLFIIMGFGFASGIVGAVLLDKDSTFAATFSCALSLGAASFFLPLYYPKMQALYESYAPIYQECLVACSTSIFKAASKGQEALKQDNNTKSEIVDIDINKEDDNKE